MLCRSPLTPGPLVVRPERAEEAVHRAGGQQAGGAAEEDRGRGQARLQADRGERPPCNILS